MKKRGLFVSGVVVVLYLFFLAAFGQATTIYELNFKGDTTGLMDNGGIAMMYTNAMNDLWTSSGSGVIDPFLTVQKNDMENGINTDGNLLYDQKRAAGPGDTGFTRSLQYSALGLSPFGFNSSYFNFSVDIDQTDNEPWLSLTQFQVYRVPFSAGGSLETLEAVQAAAYGGVPVFDLGANIIDIDYGIWKGSGSKLDVALFVPGFSGLYNDFIYVWSQFGDGGLTPSLYPDGNKPERQYATVANDGPEEWITFGESVPVPEPATMLLLGSGLLGLARFARKKFKK